MSDYNSYIYLGDNKLFGYLERKYTKFNTGGKLERSINGTAHLDRGPSKKRWSFSFETDSRGITRLENVWDMMSSITLVDWDSIPYTVIITNDFTPSFIGEDWFSVSLDMEEV